MGGVATTVAGGGEGGGGGGVGAGARGVTTGGGGFDVGGGTAGLIVEVEVGGAVCTLLTVTGGMGAVCRPTGAFEEGVAGVCAAFSGAVLPGPPGPRGTSVFTGPGGGIVTGLKPGSELRIVSFGVGGLSANLLCMVVSTVPPVACNKLTLGAFTLHFVARATPTSGRAFRILSKRQYFLWTLPDPRYVVSWKHEFWESSSSSAQLPQIPYLPSSSTALAGIPFRNTPSSLPIPTRDLGIEKIAR